MRIPRPEILLPLLAAGFNAAVIYLVARVEGIAPRDWMTATYLYDDGFYGHVWDVDFQTTTPRTVTLHVWWYGITGIKLADWTASKALPFKYTNAYPYAELPITLYAEIDGVPVEGSPVLLT